MPKEIEVCVTTMDSEMTFSIDSKCTGQKLFDQVVRTIGLREHWFFDLCYENSKGVQAWLKRHKKISSQDVPREEPIPFRFVAKFYPEECEEELLTDTTRHLVFLQVKSMVLSGEIFCPPEVSVLLASFDVHVRFGDYDPSVHKSGFLLNEVMLPQRVIDQYQMTPEMWEDRIVACFQEHSGILQSDTEMEYLKITQDLEMFGVSYFEIANKKGTRLYLGVDALGLNIYKFNDKLAPQIAFPWGEVKNISYHDKKFVIRPMESKATDFVFYAHHLEVNKNILSLCVGNHDLYMKRRSPDSMEEQQMKAIAMEERERKIAEQARLLKERKMREVAMKDRDQMAKKLNKFQRQAAQAQRDLLRSEETAQLLAEKVEMAEVESGILLKKQKDAQETISKIKEERSQTEAEKAELAAKARQAEEELEKMQDSIRKSKEEADRLQRELQEAKEKELKAQRELEELVTSGASSVSGSTRSNIVKPPNPATYGAFDRKQSTTSAGSTTEEEASIAESHLTSASRTSTAALRVEQQHLNHKSKMLKQQLKTLKTAMQDLKVDGTQTDEDVAHAKKEASGETKFDTMRRIRRGSTKARVTFFEEL